PAPGPDDVLLCIYIVEPRDARDGTYGPDRGDRVLRARRRRYGRRGNHRLHDWPVIRRNPAALPGRKRAVRGGRLSDDRADRAEASLRTDAGGPSGTGSSNGVDGCP